MKQRTKGFTLIELLIVIAIIVILAVIILLAINPAQILAKSRDSQRFSDLTTLATAINLYLADSKVFPATGTSDTRDVGCLADINICKKNDGTGWVPFDFTTVTSGAPIASLPIDPTNDVVSGVTYKYSIGWDLAAKTYELDATFEHADNAAKHASDGGDDANVYEIGTDLTIL